MGSYYRDSYIDDNGRFQQPHDLSAPQTWDRAPTIQIRGPTLERLLDIFLEKKIFYESAVGLFPELVPGRLGIQQQALDRFYDKIQTATDAEIKEFSTFCENNHEKFTSLFFGSSECNSNLKLSNLICAAFPAPPTHSHTHASKHGPCP